MKRNLSAAIIAAGCGLLSPSVLWAMSDPVVGRWVTRDPLGYQHDFSVLKGRTQRVFSAGSGDRANLYAYLAVRPLYAIDSSGLTPGMCGCFMSGHVVPPVPPPPPPPPPPPCPNPVLICVKRASFGVGNHVYFWDSCGNGGRGQSCGQDSSSGGGTQGGGYPDGGQPGPWDPVHNAGGDCCVPIQDSEGKNSQLMKCCQQHANEGLWFPGINDCHNHLDKCLSGAGLTPPNLPCGRFGDPNFCKHTSQ